MMHITSKTSPKVVSDYIAKLREQKGKENEVLTVINKFSVFGHDFVVNLLWEEALTYQHLVMNEDSKGNGGNLKVRLRNLRKMEEAVKKAGYYIVRFDLERWKSRLCRFLGRVSDYKGDYQKAISYYRKSLRTARFDPEYLEKNYPRWLEVEAFLANSLLMSGNLKKGMELSKDVFVKFDNSKEGREFKKRDYTTWVIWKSGIPVRTVKALIARKLIFNKKIMLDWLNQAEADLVKSNRLADFKYRKDEIKAVKKRLETV